MVSNIQFKLRIIDKKAAALKGHNILAGGAAPGIKTHNIKP